MSDRAPRWTVYESPLGPLTFLASAKGVTNVFFKGRGPQLAEAGKRAMPREMDQVDAYFGGRRRNFELGLDIGGHPLQVEVWRRLTRIPYGATTTYGKLAAEIHGTIYPPGIEPYARPRVVGAAIGSNPVPILIPCHRVVGADGSLIGYLGGLQRKQALLDLERDGTPRASWGHRQIAML